MHKFELYNYLIYIYCEIIASISLVNIYPLSYADQKQKNDFPCENS